MRIVLITGHWTISPLIAATPHGVVTKNEKRKTSQCSMALQNIKGYFIVS